MNPILEIVSGILLLGATLGFIAAAIVGSLILDASNIEMDNPKPKGRREEF